MPVETGHEVPDKSYDALMMDRNLTPNDKIQFLATNFDHYYPLFGQDGQQRKSNGQHMRGDRKYGWNIEHNNRITRKKRAFYDDMTYIDDNSVFENSKYNGDWYRYLIGDFPQLDNGEQRQERKHEKMKESINNGQNNDGKSVSSGRQKVFKEEKGEQRSHSVDKLW